MREAKAVSELLKEENIKLQKEREMAEVRLKKAKEFVELGEVEREKQKKVEVKRKEEIGILEMRVLELEKSLAK